MPIDATSFRVAGGLGRKNDVEVAWNGTRFLVTWQQETPTPGFKSAELLGVRIDPAASSRTAATSRRA